MRDAAAGDAAARGDRHVIVGLLLAAGGARRFGSQKLVAELDGTPIVRQSAEILAQVTDGLIVVVGHEGDRVRAAIGDITATFVENANWALGMSASLKLGFAEVPDGADAVLIALGDQPGIDADVARAVIAAWREAKRPIVVARYADGRGHPVLFSREMFAELQTIEGDQGARSVIERSGDRVAFVDVGAAAPRDIDTPDDLRTRSAGI